MTTIYSLTPAGRELTLGPVDRDTTRAHPEYTHEVRVSGELRYIGSRSMAVNVFRRWDRTQP